MEYLQGSHCGGAYEHVFRWDDPLGNPLPTGWRSGAANSDVAAQDPRRTTGHPGLSRYCRIPSWGSSRTIPRILATSAYVTPASLHGRRYETDASVQNAPWSAPAKFAVA